MSKNPRGKKTRPGFGKPIVPGTWLTFRAEVMPGRDQVERTFKVTRVLRSQRVELARLDGQHSLAEFEPLNSGTESS